MRSQQKQKRQTTECIVQAVCLITKYSYRILTHDCLLARGFVFSPGSIWGDVYRESCKRSEAYKGVIEDLTHFNIREH